jgi:sulfur carrier protein ThiS
MHKAFIIFSFLVLAVTLSFCSGKIVSENLDKWIGKFSYGEEPIKAIAGYYMTMQWELSINKKNDSCQGVLEVNGQQTYMKLLTAVSGDSNSVAITYNRLIDGLDYGLKKGDTLFILSKVAGKLITKWKVLEPGLTENSLQECNCLTMSKDNK